MLARFAARVVVKDATWVEVNPANCEVASTARSVVVTAAKFVVDRAAIWLDFNAAAAVVLRFAVWVVVRPCKAAEVSEPIPVVESAFTWVEVKVANWVEVIAPACEDVSTPISVEVRKSISVVERLVICEGVRATVWVVVRF